MKVLTQVDLAGMKCSNPECSRTHDDTQIYLNAKCHPKAATRTAYFQGVVTVECVECRLPVAHFQVAVA